MTTRGRRLGVLQAIVVEHVRTNEPVSSKTVAQSYVHGVSSATIRSDMSALEDMGLIHQPHTSAGRVPTEAGYRVFVDNLGRPKPLSERERHLLEAGLHEAEDPEDIIVRTVRLLARLTRQAAVIEFPNLAALGIRRIELVDLGADRLLVLVISTSGRVAERQIDVSHHHGGGLAQPFGADFGESSALREAGAILTAACADQRLVQAKERLAAAVEDGPKHLRELLVDAAAAVEDILRPIAGHRIASAGASNLARTDAGFQDVSQVLKALEEEAPIVEVLSGLRTDSLQVSIGAENENVQLSEASVVAARYGAGQAVPVHVGVVGPTRMDYPASLRAVKAVSASLSKLMLSDLGIEPGIEPGVEPDVEPGVEKEEVE